MHTFARSLIVILPLLASTAQAEAIAVLEKPYTALRPGLWEIKTSTRMLNMPYELPPVPYTATQCLTQELLDNQENLAKVTATRGDCDIHNVNVADDRTSWDMTCHQNGMDIEAEGYIAPITRETYTGKVDFAMHNASVQEPIKGMVNVQGIWQGECTGDAAESHVRPRYRTPVYTPN